MPLPRGPLTPRHSANAFWTGREVLIIGGRPPAACSIDAHCELIDPPPLRDGAAFHPSTGDWRRIADAPVPLGTTQGAVLNGTLYLWVYGWEPGPGVPPAFLSYDPPEDRWHQLPPPPQADRGVALVAAGTQVVAIRPSHERGRLADVAFDPSTGTWTRLPRDPLTPSFDRSMVWTGSELVLTGIDLAKSSSYSAAALHPETGRWRVFPDAPIDGAYPTWFWAGGRVVNPTTDAHPDGCAPCGGMLDPATGTWEPLPDPPEGYGPYYGDMVVVGGEDHVVSVRGWVLEVSTGRWSRLPPPVPRGRGVHHSDEAVVWAGDRLIAWGGIRAKGPKREVLNDGWAWFPT